MQVTGPLCPPLCEIHHGAFDRILISPLRQLARQARLPWARVVRCSSGPSGPHVDAPQKRSQVRLPRVGPQALEIQKACIPMRVVSTDFFDDKIDEDSNFRGQVPPVGKCRIEGLLFHWKITQHAA